MENTRGKDNKISKEIWKAVETEVEKIEMAKTKRRRKKRRREEAEEGGWKKEEEKTKKEEDDGSEKGSKRVENLG